MHENIITIKGNEPKFLWLYYSNRYDNTQEQNFTFWAFRQQKRKNEFVARLTTSKPLKHAFYFLGDLIKELKG